MALDTQRQQEAAEAAREAAEQARAEAEERRAAAERARLVSEAHRKAAESARDTASADVRATVDGLSTILEEMKAVEALRRARRALNDHDDPQTH